MSTLNLEHINKTYNGNTKAIVDFNIAIKNKEFIAIIGPSGCGKTTLLRMIAGLEDITSGTLYIDEYPMNDIAPNERNIAMVFQNAQLYPHMNVYNNLAFSLKLQKVSCPCYHNDSRLELLYNENNAYYLKLMAIFANLVKKKYQNRQNELIDEADKWLVKMYRNEEKVAALRKPLMGIDEEKIKNLKIKAKKIARLRDKNKHIELHKKIKADIKYYQTHKMPLFKKRKLTDYEIALRVFRLATILDLKHLLMRKPNTLSGGEKQRVAIGVAAIKRPKILLLDEPLAHLDEKSRIKMRQIISDIHKDINATTIYVTHDQTAAMALADRLVILKDGYVQQIDTPNNVFMYPKNTFVASFTTNPTINLLKAMFNGDHLLFTNKKKTVSYALNLSNIKALKTYCNNAYPLIVAMRPDDIICKSGGINVICDYKEKIGVEAFVHAHLLDQKITIKCDDKLPMKSGSKISIDFAKKSLLFFDEKTGALIPNFQEDIKTH